MNVKIIKGNLEQLEDCRVALSQSELGTTYYSDPEKIISFFEDGFSKGEIYVVINNDGHCIGYIRFTLNGMLGSFPYARNLAVKQEYRGRGIGRDLLQFYEQEGFRHSDKIFIMVSDFNTRAKRLYEEIGYKQIGAIHDLYKAGVTENVLMKLRLPGYIT